MDAFNIKHIIVILKKKILEGYRFLRLANYNLRRYLRIWNILGCCSKRSKNGLFSSLSIVIVLLKNPEPAADVELLYNGIILV